METAVEKCNEASCEGDRGQPSPGRDRNFWDGRAAEFSKHAKETQYAEGFLSLMKVDPHSTVLDMACGGGTLAIPLAGRVKRVTAVDFSGNMLEILKRRCREKGIENVTPLHGSWEDDWDVLGIGTHDVAIGSRSILSKDARVSITKLNHAARKAVYISTSVGDGPFDRRIFEATGREFNIGPSYIHYYNLLYELGIHANIAFVREDHPNEWANREGALEAQRWMFQGLKEEEEEKVRRYLDERLVKADGKWRLPYKRQCKWAVMWWEKE
jgi:SAM-dependent methyltransferase